MTRWLSPWAALLFLANCHGASESRAVPPVAPLQSAGGTPSSTASGAPLLLLDPSEGGHHALNSLLGANMATWYDITQSGIAPSFSQAAMTTTRWPGGSESDTYHWATNSVCQQFGGYVNPNSTFDNFMKDVAIPAHLDVAITLDYGTNATCNGGGDPSEAAAWVDYANKQHYGINWWTVGNEVYGSWETDLHAKKNDPTTYANAVATGFYPQIKAKSANAQVGVVVEPSFGSWDQIVLSKAKYDFVELHFYAQAPGQESDSYLITQGAQALTTSIFTLKSELRAAGREGTPIYVGELGSVYANPGKQSMSITQALYAGQVIGELAKDGIARATWWLGYGGCGNSGNFSPSLYGWQNFGGYMVFSDGTVEDGCSATEVPRGTLLPTAAAFEVASHFIRTGEHTIGVTLQNLPNVRAYASTYQSGYALLLFNLSQTASVNVPVEIVGKSSSSGGSIVTYDKSLYDASKMNMWLGPVPSTLAPWSKSFTLNLPAWSETAVVTK